MEDSTSMHHKNDLHCIAHCQSLLASTYESQEMRKEPPPERVYIIERIFFQLLKSGIKSEGKDGLRINIELRNIS